MQSHDSILTIMYILSQIIYSKAGNSQLIFRGFTQEKIGKLFFSSHNFRLPLRAAIELPEYLV